MDKINIAELLKDCPKGMELDCTIWDNVTFECVDDREEFSIIIRLSDGCREAVTDYGCYSENDGAKCVIFPKGKTTWEGFKRPFKDGDILTTNIGSIFIFSHLKPDCNVDRNICKAYVGIRDTMPISFFHTEQSDIFGPYESMCKLATEEEKAKLFQAIKENGYRWNSETKTLEELTELTESSEDVDDRLVMSDIYFDRENYADEVELHLNNYEIENREGKTYAIFKNQKIKSIKPKFKVGDRIRHKNDKTVITITGIKDDYYFIQFYNISRSDYQNEKVSFKEQDKYELVPNKFDITTLKPFKSRVLVRNDEKQFWISAFWGCYSKEYVRSFVVTGGNTFEQCIPYERNEHLLGTTDDCDEYFKTWK